MVIECILSIYIYGHVKKWCYKGHSITLAICFPIYNTSQLRVTPCPIMGLSSSCPHELVQPIFPQQGRGQFLVRMWNVHSSS